ncbi:MAG TPA: hypothetical protein DCY07_02365 [Rhodospirillaceae bacterium]|nr:hypothetical protein [Rhodospirillaceae bacterium]
MLRVTQNAVEVVRKPTNADLRITQAAIEVVRRPASRHGRITQAAMEVLRQNVAAATGTAQQPLVIIIAG